MLIAMEIPAAAALLTREAATVPAIALGVVLGIVLVTVAGLVAYLVARRPRAPGGGDPSGSAVGAGPGLPEDDLPGFLEFPPGAAGAPTVARDGWPALAGTGAPERPAAPAAAPKDRDTRVVLGAMSAVALLLVGAAAAVATASRSAEPEPARAAATTSAPSPTSGTPTAPPVPAAPSPGDPGAGVLAEDEVPLGPDGVEVRLGFGGVVLERHAVGVTATYPAVRMTSDGEQSLAHLELPTFHCLTAEAPDDPAVAGCVRSVTEYAELATPGLEVTERDGDVRLSGRFATYVRPNGGPPVWTGHVYELLVTAESAPGRAPTGWRPAAGSLRLGPDRTDSTDDPEVNLLRRGS
jgi:hypothetical protein